METKGLDHILVTTASVGAVTLLAVLTGLAKLTIWLANLWDRRRRR